MFCRSTLLSSLLLVGPMEPPRAAAGEPPDAVEKLVTGYCARHGLARDELEVWKSSLAPDGRAFRYKLPAAPAQGKREALAERYAFVFVDPDAGNVYDVKRTPGGDKEVGRRAWAVLRLMGTKVGDKRAEAVMADLYRLGSLLDRAHREDPFTVRLAQTEKGETWADPAVTYHADLSGALRLYMTVDGDGYVTSFRVGNIR